MIGALGWRMRDLQIVQNERYRLLAEENRINIRLIPPARGIIFDRDGRLMAGNRQNYRIVMVREQAGDPEAVLARLASIIAAAAPTCGSGRCSEMSAPQRLRAGGGRRAPDLGRRRAGRGQRAGPARGDPRGRPQPLLPRRRSAPAHVVGYVGPVSESDLAKLEDPDPLLQIPRFQIGKTGVEQRLEADAARRRPATCRSRSAPRGRVMRELGRVEGTARQGHAADPRPRRSRTTPCSAWPARAPPPR